MVDGPRQTDSDILKAYRAKRSEDASDGTARTPADYLAMFPGLDRALVAAESGGAASDDPDRIGPYKRGPELGRGGQAVVYLAEDERLNRKVALKVFLGLGGAHGDVLARFRREAEITSGLEHPGICPVYETGVHDGAPWIAMRFVEGRSLAAMIAESRGIAIGDDGAGSVLFDLSGPGAEAVHEGQVSDLDEGRGPVADRGAIVAIIELVEKAARALHVAHEAGVVHRDIKPGNVMITSRGEPVLLDFGLASIDEGGGPTITRSGDLMGTPAYMSPEQIAARIRLDRRTDVYSLGVTLYECLTLRRPFDAPSREGLYRAILTESPTDPTSFNPHISPELRLVLECALEKNPERRYRTAEAFAEDLARVRRLEPIAARPVSRWLKTARLAQRNPVVATMTVTAFAALLVVAVVFFLKNRELDASNDLLDRSNTELATKEASAKAALADVERLSDARVLADLEVRAENDLWPAIPEKTDAMRDWLDEAERLLSRADTHREKLAVLRTRALPYDDEQRAEDWAPELAKLEELASHRSEMEAAAVDASGKTLDRLEDGLESVEREIQDLRARVQTQRTWSFASTEDAWLHGLLADLVERLDAFTANESGTLSSVRDRLVFAGNLKERTIDAHALGWRRTIEGIAKSEKYPGLREVGFEPQIGLIPLGPDPSSELFEFLHLASHEGPLPERGPDGRLARTEKTGIILVLIPGDRFDMGAQRDPAAPNHDEDARPEESPVHSVTLSAFFLSKYEMTQGQWARVQGGAAPSNYRAGTGHWGNRPVTLLHPVEQVSWVECDRALSRIDLELPTEAQWEYGTRAGSSSVWFTGSDVASLQSVANIADEGSARFYPPGWNHEEDFVDGYAIHAPVGSFGANAFGLHDVHGNVFEWCRDHYGPYSEDNVESGTGRRHVTGSGVRINRGGSFNTSSFAARSAHRNRFVPSFRMDSLGLRPARSRR